jgi:transposase-like protein
MTLPEKKRRRSRCKVCKQTLSERRGTMFEGLRKPIDLVLMVRTLLSSGCPVQAMVQACHLDERPLAQPEEGPHA